MSLSNVSILLDQETIPGEVEKFFGDISSEVERHRTKVPAGYRGFVPSDYRKLYSVLRLIERKRLTCGMKFCEWGSGIGVATMIASMVGFEAHGIEIDAGLVEVAEGLIQEHRIGGQYCQRQLCARGRGRPNRFGVCRKRRLDIDGDRGGRCLLGVGPRNR